ncbi:AsmA family protein [Tahibacter amnicola]|uniref:AsmA family protein n=1 Tax=Tahibacter amnicola TaxID=2976241 RepID=A0ABY6BBR1_9GAMM|nr:AsmA family protein [Tahibacter amnicola]UXI67488.1 AsmA family protein [Tahibacter amnicola]
MTIRRSVRVVVAVLLLLAGTALLLVRHYANPEKVAKLLVDTAATHLRLTLAFDGLPRYAFWPALTLELDHPRLSVPGRPGNLLEARSIGVVLPWRSMVDSQLVIEKVVIDSPALALDPLDHWQSTAPSGGGLPDAQAFIHIRNGQVQRAGKPVIKGLDVEGEVDLHAIDRWWRSLPAPAADATPFPPVRGRVDIAEAVVGGVVLKGLHLEATPD